MADTREQFLKNEIAEALAKLAEDTQSLWGIMTPQHMIEHLTGTWIISNGRFSLGPDRLAVTEDSLETRREFLFSERPYEKNITNPVQGNGLQPLRKSSLEEAKETLLKNIELFFTYHDENPEAVFLHPVFGDLNREGWIIFQNKHMRHHLDQFGLL